MPADSYGIIVEGGYDSTVYETIIRRLASHEVRIVPRACEGKRNVKHKFPGFLDSFKYSELGGPVDMAIVIVDADGQDPTALEAEMRAKVATRQYRFAVHVYAVTNAMEAWLLADPDTVNRAMQGRTSKRVTKTHHAPETLLDPKLLLQQLLTGIGVDYTAAVAAEIAQQIDPQVLAGKCPRFRDFAELVDC
jgi:hypothetical protein